MEAREFLYHFTDVLFSEIVKETILIENWEESDFDHRYAEYITIFQNMADACLTKGSTDQDLMSSLTESKKTIITLFNEKMKDNFTAEFAHFGITKPVDVERLMPPNLFSADAINTDMLSIFRTFEEETFKGKEGR